MRAKPLTLTLNIVSHHTDQAWRCIENFVTNVERVIDANRQLVRRAVEEDSTFCTRIAAVL